MMEMEPDLVDDVALGDGGAMLDALMMLVDDASPGDGGAMLDAMMMLDLLDDGALAFDDPDDDGLGAIMEMT